MGELAATAGAGGGRGLVRSGSRRFASRRDRSGRRLWSGTFGRGRARSSGGKAAFQGHDADLDPAQPVAEPNRLDEGDDGDDRQSEQQQPEQEEEQFHRIATQPGGNASQATTSAKAS
jgi:hypothetical protein